MPRWLKLTLVSVLIIALAIPVVGPIGPVPGLFIGGQAANAPNQWGELPHEVLLQTQGGLLPRVVTIWVVEYEQDLYVFGQNGSGWVEATRKDGNIRLRIEDKTYNLHAQAVTEFDEAIYQAYVERYQADYPEIVAGFPTENFLAVGTGFKLTPR